MKTTEDMVEHNETTIKKRTQHNWNEASDIAKDKNVLKTLIKDCLYDFKML